ncbi:MAG: TlpA family protein disulfide reductase [Muribaculaceae bacterium]|nr:TlpA family protein disulfide reductase [Muribaculaceae bacterium]MDE5713158.1 TlpA family protein disulfide reductase [Muribaculaceae bacterium]
MNINSIFSGLFISVLICLTATACVTENEPANTGLAEGDPLPQFNLTLDNGSSVSTTSLRGKTAVIEFFNTSCGDCREGLPAINRLYEEYNDHPLISIFAVSREEDAVSVGNYWAEHNFSLPYSAQSDRLIYNLFATSGIPRTFITDASGRIVATFGDSDIPDFHTLKSVVDSLTRHSSVTNPGQSPD